MPPRDYPETISSLSRYKQVTRRYDVMLYAPRIDAAMSDAPPAACREDTRCRADIAMLRHTHTFAASVTQQTALRWDMSQHAATSCHTVCLLPRRLTATTLRMTSYVAMPFFLPYFHYHILPRRRHECAAISFSSLSAFASVFSEIFSHWDGLTCDSIAFLLHSHLRHYFSLFILAFNFFREISFIIAGHIMRRINYQEHLYYIAFCRHITYYHIFLPSGWFITRVPRLRHRSSFARRRCRQRRHAHAHAASAFSAPLRRTPSLSSLRYRHGYWEMPRRRRQRARSARRVMSSAREIRCRDHALCAAMPAASETAIRATTRSSEAMLLMLYQVLEGAPMCDSERRRCERWRWGHDVRVH